MTLLKEFGSIARIRRSTPERLAELPGISRDLAVRILEKLAARKPLES